MLLLTLAFFDSVPISSLLCLHGWGVGGWQVISRKPTTNSSVGSAAMASCRRAADLAVWGMAAGPLPHLHLWLGSLSASTLSLCWLGGVLRSSSYFTVVTLCFLGSFLYRSPSFSVRPHFTASTCPSTGGLLMAVLVFSGPTYFVLPCAPLLSFHFTPRTLHAQVLPQSCRFPSRCLPRPCVLCVPF